MNSVPAIVQKVALITGASRGLGRVLRDFDVNTLAPLALVREALPLLTRARGLVVNITSDAAVGGYPGWGVYGASKAALELVSKTLAAELKDRDVAVVAVDPGDMRTRMHQDAYLGQEISDRPLPDVTLPFWAWLLSQLPMKVSGMRYQAQAAVWDVAACGARSSSSSDPNASSPTNPRSFVAAP